MMLMKKLLTLFIIIALIFLPVLAGCGSGTKPIGGGTQSGGNNTGEIVLKVGTVAPPAHSYSLGLEEFAKLMDDVTNGQLKFEIYGGGQLGGEIQMTEQIVLGTLDMGLITTGPVGNFMPELVVLEMPYIFRDLEHAYKALDGEVGLELLDKLESVGLKGMAFWENGFRHISNSKRPILSPDDMRGLKMRTVEMDIFVDTYRAMGADPTPIAFPEVYTSFQQGVIDGFDASIGVFTATKMYEVQKHFSELGFYYTSCILLINPDKFKSLPADIQEKLIKHSREFAGRQRQINQGMESDQKKVMQENGVIIANKGDIDFPSFVSAVEPVYVKHAARFGDYVERIRNIK